MSGVIETDAARKWVKTDGAWTPTDEVHADGSPEHYVNGLAAAAEAAAARGATVPVHVLDLRFTKAGGSVRLWCPSNTPDVAWEDVKLGSVESAEALKERIGESGTRH